MGARVTSCSDGSHKESKSHEWNFSLWFIKQHAKKVRRGNELEVSGHLHFPPTLSRGKSLCFSLHERLGGPLSRCDAAEDGTTYLPRLETTPQLFHRPALKLGYNCNHVNFSVLLQARAMAIEHMY